MCKISLHSWYNVLAIYDQFYQSHDMYALHLADIRMWNTSVKCAAIQVNSNYSTHQNSMCLHDGSDTSHSVYLRVVFMTKVVVHPEAII